MTARIFVATAYFDGERGHGDGPYTILVDGERIVDVVGGDRSAERGELPEAFRAAGGVRFPIRSTLVRDAEGVTIVAPLAFDAAARGATGRPASPTSAPSSASMRSWPPAGSARSWCSRSRAPRWTTG